MAIESATSNLSNTKTNISTIQSSKQTKDTSKTAEGNTTFKDEMNMNMNIEAETASQTSNIALQEAQGSVQAVDSELVDNKNNLLNSQNLLYQRNGFMPAEGYSVDVVQAEGAQTQNLAYNPELFDQQTSGMLNVDTRSMQSENDMIPTTLETSVVNNAGVLYKNSEEKDRLSEDFTSDNIELSSSEDLTTDIQLMMSAASNVAAKSNEFDISNASNIASKSNEFDISAVSAKENTVQQSVRFIPATVSVESNGKHIKTELSINEQDAEFFVNLVNDNANGVNAQSIAAQAQNAVDTGADVQQVQKSAHLSEALLNAINTAKETNQPLRIDFDNNVAVILRVSKDGTIAANFIPGDKAVEQYLRNNIDLLKNNFDENNLPYSDLSYSNSSKEQNRRRRNQSQQGE